MKIHNMKVESEVRKGRTRPANAPQAANGEVYVFPVTFVQRRLLLLEQLDPTRTSYGMVWSLRMTGELNADALERSLNEMVCRHQILRTTFQVIDGQPAQIVSPELRIPLIVVDLTGLPEPEQEAQALAMKEAQTSVDLRNGPVMRTILLCLAATDHVLLLTMHPIVFDPWSRRIFVSELATIYEAFSAGRQSPLPELPLQYADYAVWQRNYLQGEKLDKLLSYWKEQLAGAPATLDLPTDRQRREVQSFRVASRSFVIPYTLCEEVTRTSLRARTTTFMTLLAGLEVLLSRYSGQGDIVVGIPIANRVRAEIESVIGNFANTLVLRIKLDGNPTFGELLQRVKDTSLAAYAHQDMPFERLVEELRPERKLGHNPLFQVLFSLQDAPRGAFEVSGLQLKPVAHVSGSTAKLDISVFIRRGEDGLSGRVEYNTDLFNTATIDRMVQDYLGLLEGALADPATHISQLPLRRSHNDKVARRVLSAPRLGSESRNRTVLPRNDLEATVLRVWQRVLGLESIGVTDNFFDVGGHSLLAVRVIMEIEKAIGKRLPVSTIFEGPTVEHLASSLVRLDQSPNKLIVEIQGGNAKPPFFGIVAPGARGFFVDLARHLGEDQPFYRIQGTSPQPERRPYTAFEYENLAAEYIEAMKTAQPRGPYYLGGMCQGARVAFDMARLLEAQGESVGLLAIFDTWVIENSRNRLLFLADKYFMHLMKLWRGTRRKKWQTLLRGIKHPFRRRGPSKPLMTTLFPGREFIPATCAATITVFKTPKQRWYRINDPLLGWGTRTTGVVEVQLVDSIHRYLLVEPYVRPLAEKLADSLAHASSRTGDDDPKRTSGLVASAASPKR